mmetsp:Transcript_19583/g.32208  ORF Transcript_19583/g.32208 Transcript_19583/m.32208 type:complete len:80 (+) Transcript_19583:193-432(+)|eukprot:CAMPEP_0203760016 /NCGR_PEP_ID=MMETSP0098-20131031/13408_1 /ASSEMBLY_ACC=CAM_ASM_000208 /TAXON_ID=96639 /ORGANISM=" , Strain NY0313808BC1" /LENGTH=79 /DNA_ID=CAMNT_0050653429 /DNA_START=168 /DNA_END=407 /DNA_ORIENTATION=+
MARGSPFVRSGLPLVLMVVCGAYGLSFMIEGKQDIDVARSNKRTLTPREYDLEEDYRKTMRKLDLTKGYDIVRIPREDE